MKLAWKKIYDNQSPGFWTENVTLFQLFKSMVNSVNENDIITEVSNQEIDKDIEQYIRSEDEINFIRKLHARKY